MRTPSVQLGDGVCGDPWVRKHVATSDATKSGPRGAHPPFFMCIADPPGPGGDCRNRRFDLKPKDGRAVKEEVRGLGGVAGLCVVRGLAPARLSQSIFTHPITLTYVGDLVHAGEAGRQIVGWLARPGRRSVRSPRPFCSGVGGSPRHSLRATRRGPGDGAGPGRASTAAAGCPAPVVFGPRILPHVLGLSRVRFAAARPGQTRERRGPRGAKRFLNPLPFPSLGPHLSLCGRVVESSSPKPPDAGPPATSRMGFCDLTAAHFLRAVRDPAPRAEG